VGSLIAAAVGLALGLSGAAAGHATTLLADREEPGANRPPAGQSLFDELFAIAPIAARGHDAGYDLPFPFERLLAELNARIAPAAATGVLIPLGRSLQRHAADPDYFASPRVVIAVTDDAGAPGRPLVNDRLYLGYHERAEVIEVISYNEAAGRFEFQVVEDYGPDRAPRVRRGERFVCVACHQAHGPIFPTAVWNETNADPRVAARLAALGTTFHGVPTRGGVDRADAIDRSTDRAARIAFANALWGEGCGPPDEPDATRCRGDLLLAALRYRLGGARAAPNVGADAASAALAKRLGGRLPRLAPAGLGASSPDLPNRDPLAEIEAGVAPDLAIEPEGVFEPTLERAPVVFWQPSTPAGELLATAVGDIAAMFADADIVWLDDRLAALEPEPPGLAQARLQCRTRSLEAGPGRRELRLACEADSTQPRAMLEGHVVLADDVPNAGMIERLALDGHAPVSRLVVAGGSHRREASIETMQLRLRESGLGLRARLAGGEQLAPLQLRIGPDGEAALELRAVDDLAPLRAALTGMVERALADPGAAVGAGPLRRRAVLDELAAALEPG
jgi:hypothetical protein